MIKKIGITLLLLTVHMTYAMIPRNYKILTVMTSSLQRTLTTTRTVEEGAIYKHYKRKDSEKTSHYLYKVLDVSNYSEDISKLMVTYKALYPTPGLSGKFTRPYDMFVEDVEVDGKMVPRFEIIKNSRTA